MLLHPLPWWDYLLTQKKKRRRQQHSRGAAGTTPTVEVGKAEPHKKEDGRPPLHEYHPKGGRRRQHQPKEGKESRMEEEDDQSELPNKKGKKAGRLGANKVTKHLRDVDAGVP